MVTKDQSFVASSEPAEEKIYAAEKRIASVRFAVVLLNSLVFLFLMDQGGSILGLAYTIVVLALFYSLFVIVYKPYKKHPLFLTSYSTYSTDALFITLWVYTTGGFESPFYLLFYISIIAVSFRFSSRTIWITAFLYSACYLALLIALGELGQNLADLTVRIGYIFCTAYLGIMISGETLSQMKQKRDMQKLVMETRNAEENLRVQSTLYQNLIKAQSEMGEGVSIIEDDKFVYVNDAFCQIFGYEEKELLAFESALHLLVQEEREVIEKRHNTMTNGGLLSEGGQTVGSNKDGELIFLTYSYKIMKTKGKRQLFTIVRDITSEVRSRESLLQKTIDLTSSRELDRKKDEFIGVASHELKTPLTSINGYTQLLEEALEDQSVDPAMAKVYVKKTQYQIDRLTGLINDLLDVSRIQAGKLIFNMTEFDIGELLEAVCESMQLTAKNCSIIRKNYINTHVFGDKVRIEQVLINLVSNALKYSPKTDVVVGMEKQDGKLMIYVQDFGSGIPAEDLQKIFNRFYRVKSTEKQVSGLGIGLFISQEIIERHNGTIWAESVYGEGSTFYFTLPIAS